MSEIPAAVLRDLNAGRAETVTLVELLAVDMVKLLRAVLPEVGLAENRTELVRAARDVADEGVMRRMREVGAILHSAMQDHRQRDAIFESLATHRSDVVRSWAAFSVDANRSLSLTKRLKIMKRFATDSHMGVRECAWSAFRTHIKDSLDAGLKHLRKWVVHADENIRRCAIEGTRPRGVWCAHIPELKNDPQRALDLLEPVRSDSARYVQNAVANWLNDASKSQPEWVLELTARWTRESDTQETAYIVRRALRTLNKT